MVEKQKTMKWSMALAMLENGEAHAVSRVAWNEEVSVSLQLPDTNSKMTLPYLYMVKGNDKFPVTLSCESQFADDWYVVF
jgi:hypothetical protein